MTKASSLRMTPPHNIVNAANETGHLYQGAYGIYIVRKNSEADKKMAELKEHAWHFSEGDEYTVIADPGFLPTQADFDKELTIAKSDRKSCLLAKGRPADHSDSQPCPQGPARDPRVPPRVRQRGQGRDAG